MTRFDNIKAALKDIFAPVLFKEQLDNDTHIITSLLPLKEANVSVPNPTASAQEKSFTSHASIKHLRK